jgi:hypothetical protein
MLRYLNSLDASSPMASAHQLRFKAAQLLIRAAREKDPQLSQQTVE